MAFISSFLPAFIADQTLYGMEYPLGQFGSAVLGLSPPKIFFPPSLLVRGKCCRASLCQCCSAVGKILLCYQCISSYKYKHSSMRAAMGKINSISVKSQYNCPWNYLTHATKCNITPAGSNMKCLAFSINLERAQNNHLLSGKNPKTSKVVLLVLSYLRNSIVILLHRIKKL